MNNSLSLAGHVSTLLVYGFMPNLGFSSNSFATTTTERKMAVANGTNSMTHSFSKRQVRDALRSRNSPKKWIIHETPLESQVLVFPIHECDGSLPLTDCYIETCTVLDIEGPQDFCSTTGKQYHYHTLHNIDCTERASQSTLSKWNNYTLVALNLLQVLLNTSKYQFPKNFARLQKENESLPERGALMLVGKYCAHEHRTLTSSFFGEWMTWKLFKKSENF